MTSPKEFERPLGSQIGLEHLKDGIQISLPFQGSPISWLPLSFAGAAIFLLWANFTILPRVQIPINVLSTSVVILAILVMVGVWRYLTLRGPLIIADYKGLNVQIPFILHRRRLQWAREHLKAIGVWGGLWIVANSKHECFFDGRDADELLWIAGILRQTLNVSQELPPRPDEIDVTLTGTFWSDQEPVPACLQIRPGEMMLRHPLAAMPHLWFRTGIKWLRKSTFPEPILISNEDIILRIPEQGAPFIQIAPLQQRVVTVHVREGVAGQKRKVEIFTKLYFNLKCEDPEALKIALGRFQGGARETA